MRKARPVRAEAQHNCARCRRDGTDLIRVGRDWVCILVRPCEAAEAERRAKLKAVEHPFDLEGFDA